MDIRGFVGGAVIGAVLAAPALATDPKQIESDYRQLQKWQYATQPIVISQPITITRDTATWTLQSGSVRLADPTSSGRITGMVFEGQGRFTMTIPDPVELVQLRRFTQRSAMESIDESFSELVFRTSDDTLNHLGTSTGPYVANAIASKRQNHWLIELRSDVDARIIAAMVNPGALQITAGMKTADFDWLTYDYDSSLAEEITLTRWARSFPEMWISLDRAEDRGRNGRPGPQNVRAARLTHINVKADLARFRLLGGRSGATQQRDINGHYTVEETLAPNTDGTVALRLQLIPTAQNLSARDESGPLFVLRDRIGARSIDLDNRIYDAMVTLILTTPLQAGKPRHITFDYDLETSNYAPGNFWYPTIPQAFDANTARLELLVSKRHQVRAMGRLQSESENEKGKTTIWLVEKPAKMITFSTAERFDEAIVELPDVPKVISFGSTFGFGSATRVRNVGADVVNSLKFYQWLFDDKLDVPQIYVTSITGGHGQAFDGFLHLSEFSYDEHPGASELFRAHEVAHEWWGHKIGWKSYRDQWLSESFAEYSAMMFVQATVKNGENYFNEILQSYEGVVKGNMSGGFSKFNRPWFIDWNPSHRARLGPIALGYRASTSDIPAGYQIQTYIKGPLVLHMLRMLLLTKTHSDDLFVKILRDFVKDYSSKEASTEDFQRIVEHDAPGDWSFFFNAWVYGAEIPNYTWKYRVDPAGNEYKLSVTVTRTGGPENFMAGVPVRVDFDNGRSGMFIVFMRKREQEVTQNLPSKPKKVTIAPEHSLLANIRQE
jgi:hypothetical protein